MLKMKLIVHTACVLRLVSINYLESFNIPLEVNIYIDIPTDISISFFSLILLSISMFYFLYDLYAIVVHIAWTRGW